MNTHIKWFNEIGIHQVHEVGGKNASLGEMTRELEKLGVKVPYGFATTAEAFRHFTAQQGLAAKINERLASLDTHDVKSLNAAGTQIRQWVMDTPFLPEFEKSRDKEKNEIIEAKNA